MKKVVALLMAAVLTVGMTVTAFAAPSPSANADIVTAAKDADGNEVLHSKIVPCLHEGAVVTTSRNDVDYVVTEYGVAQLHGKSLRERAKALINIAAPEFREALGAEYEKRFHEKLEIA